MARSDTPGETVICEVPIPASCQTPHVMTATIAAGLSQVVIIEETGRLRRCQGEDCQVAIVDLTGNRSKRFCDSGPAPTTPMRVPTEPERKPSTTTAAPTRGLMREVLAGGWPVDGFG